MIKTVMEIWANAKTGEVAYLDFTKLTIAWVGRKGRYYKHILAAHAWLIKHGYHRMNEYKGDVRE